MTFAGMLRIRNEAAWIREVIASLLPLCDRVFVMDDHSTDGTGDICRSFGERVIVFESPFEGLDEARDKDWLLDQIRAAGGADIIVAIDGDEVLEPDGPPKIRRVVEQGPHIPAWAFQVLYLWNDDATVRMDGVYSRMFRPSMFRLAAAGHGFKRTPYGGGANLHCSSVPGELLPYFARADVRLKHYGYRDPAKRLEKYRYYNTVDPGNAFEDQYRHIVQGDIPEVPAHAHLRHAGPLKLEPITF